MIFPAEKDIQDLDSLASKVKELGLEKPVDFLVESHFPLSNLVYHLSLLVEPIMSPFLSVSRIGNLSKMLTDENRRTEFLSKLRRK